MPTIASRNRLGAFFCAFAVLVCALAGRPFAQMGVSDDWSYIHTAKVLAQTGHIAYNGWGAPILGWQLYFAALFIKLFGFSFTVVRLTTLLTSMANAWLLQRCLVRIGLTERNAVLGALTLVLSPIYLLLSVTFLSDIQGLFAVVICLYGCIRALQASSPRHAISWICCAAVANAIFGTSRQVAWLGLLVMVPSTLWLLRKQRHVFISGIVITCLCVVFIFGCIHWFDRQPYVVVELHFLSHHPGAAKFVIFPNIPKHFGRAFLDLPFLLLPVMMAFVAQIRRSSRRLVVLFTLATLAYILTAVLLFSRHGANSILEPMLGDWFGLHGYYDSIFLAGDSTVVGNRLIEGSHPFALHTGLRIVLTIATMGSLFGLIASLSRSRSIIERIRPDTLSWKQMCVVLLPFGCASIVILIPRASIAIFDRYLLGLMLVAIFFLVRYYQDFVQLRLPAISVFVLCLYAAYGIGSIHDMFALNRARVAAADEMHAAGIADADIDGGWEYDATPYLERAGHINSPAVLNPPDSYVPVLLPPDTACYPRSGDMFANFEPQYALSFDPAICQGLAPFTPIQYSSWLTHRQATLYIVRYR